jgi:hypothetical protein
MSSTPASILASVLGIVASGLCGGLAGWSVIALLGWSGVGGALVAAVIGMVVATGVWVGLTSLLRALRLLP